MVFYKLNGRFVLLQIQSEDDTSQGLQPDVSYPNSSTPQSVTLSLPSPSTTIDNRPQSRSSNSSSTRSRKRRVQEEPISYALDRLENISATINANNNEYDEFHHFAQNVAAQLRALPLYEALDVQNEIQQLLTAARRRHHYPNIQAITLLPPTRNTQTMIENANTITTLPDALLEQDSTVHQQDLLTKAWDMLEN